MKSTIKSEWSTPRLVISDLKEDEIQCAQDLYSKSEFMKEWSGEQSNPQYVRHCFYEGDLPPNGVKGKFKIQVVRKITEIGIAGLLIIYHGYPHDECVYVTFLFLDPTRQRLGLGQELVQELFIRLKQLGYSEVRSNVQLKNWPGLKFWTRAGLTTIAGIYGDSVYSQDTFADIKLSGRL